jgi:hypothetical protein
LATERAAAAAEAEQAEAERAAAARAEAERLIKMQSIDFERLAAGHLTARCLPPRPRGPGAGGTPRIREPRHGPERWGAAAGGRFVEAGPLGLTWEHDERNRRRAHAPTRTKSA